MKIPALTLLLFILLVGLSVAQKKKSAADFFYEGEDAMDENKYQLALAHFNECIHLDPYFMDAYRSRASAREALGDIKGALIDFSIYLESKPSQTDALFSRAVLRYRLGQYLPAREDFLLLLRLPPGGETNKIIFRQDGAAGTDKIFTMQGSNHSEIFNYLALIETRLMNYKAAFENIDSAIRLTPGEPNYFVNRGIIKEHAIDTAGAIADYEFALKLDPSDAAAIHNLAVIKRSRGLQEESEKLLNQAIQQNPSLPYPYAARAYYRFNHQNPKGALADYDKVLEIDKGDAESWLYRGMIKERLNDDDGAFVDFTEAISLKPDYARAWLTRGNLLKKLKRLEDAIDDYTVAITWYSEYGMAYYNRALARQQLAKMIEACEDLIQAEKMNVKIQAGLKEKVCR